jgi:hypothetical protein
MVGNPNAQEPCLSLKRRKRMARRGEQIASLIRCFPRINRRSILICHPARGSVCCVTPSISQSFPFQLDGRFSGYSPILYGGYQSLG